MYGSRVPKSLMNVWVQGSKVPYECMGPGFQSSFWINGSGVPKSLMNVWVQGSKVPYECMGPGFQSPTELQYSLYIYWAIIGLKVLDHTIFNGIPGQYIHGGLETLEPYLDSWNFSIVVMQK